MIGFSVITVNTRWFKKINATLKSFFFPFLSLTLYFDNFVINMSRRRSLSDSEDEEMEYAPSSSKRIKLSSQTNGSSSQTNTESDDNEEEAQTLNVDDDG
jgi:hypothetical protein